MFTASQYEFRSSPDVRRNFPFPTLRTEEAPTRWLLGKCNTRGHKLPPRRPKPHWHAVHFYLIKCFALTTEIWLTSRMKITSKILHRTAAVTGLVVAVQSHLKAPSLVSKETLPWLLMGLCLNLCVVFVCVCVCVRRGRFRGLRAAEGEHQQLDRWLWQDLLLLHGEEPGADRLPEPDQSVQGGPSLQGQRERDRPNTSDRENTPQKYLKEIIRKCGSDATYNLQSN